MAKTPYQARLDGDLLAWARGYAKERGTTVTAIIEAGLRELQGLATGGVPDLEGVQAVRTQVDVGLERMRTRVPGVTPTVAGRVLSEHERLMRERQARLNKRAGK